LTVLIVTVVTDFQQVKLLSKAIDPTPIKVSSPAAPAKNEEQQEVRLHWF